MTFLAVRKSVTSRSTPSLDTEVKLVLVTDDVSVLDLGKDDSQTLYKISIEKE